MPETHTLPPGWRTVSLGKILTHEQTEKVAAIVNNPKLDTKRVQVALRDYFYTIADDLNEQEIDPNYLSYALAWQLLEARKPPWARPTSRSSWCS